MKGDTTYQKLYESLNAAQRAAVDAIEGPVMVVAGPGTGKTQVLTLRIANILLKTQVNPENILALTFTEAAAANMRERLATVIGSPAYSVHLFTFHAFCQRIIEDHPDDFWPLLGRRLADEVNQVEILEHVFDQLDVPHIKPYGEKYYYVSAAMRAVSELKREGVSPDELEQMVAAEKKAFDAAPDKESKRAPGKMTGEYQDLAKRIDKNTELVHVYRAYEKNMKSAGLYDYDDLIMETLAKLQRDEDFRLRVMEKYQYMLVDEHQDSNNAQNKILTLLSSYGENPNIFVVGDSKQAIFRFQGASVENFNHFRTLYPQATLITLTDNYRSTQTILDSALQMLAADEKLKAHADSKKKDLISVLASSSTDDELASIADHVKHDIDSGTPPEKIAILVRTNVQGKLVARALEHAGIHAHANLKENIFDTLYLQKFMTLLEAIADFGDGEKLFRALHLDFLGVSPMQIYLLSQKANRGRRDMIELMAESEDKAILKLYTKLHRWATLAKNIPVQELLRDVAHESGYITYLAKQDNPLLALAPIRGLYNIFSSVSGASEWKLDDLFAYVERLREHGLSVKTDVYVPERGRVVIMTVHGAKGLEWDRVYIPFCTDNVWGSKRSRGKLFYLPDAVYGGHTSPEDAMNDEKRLFFVALTRARLAVTISYSQKDATGKVLLPSPFIDLIDPSLKSVIVEPPRPAADLPAELTYRAEPDSTFEIFRDFVRDSFEHYTLSVSALNNYLQCPWRYFYVNLVRVPSGKSEPLMFGNAVHDGLTQFWQHYKETGEKTLEYLLASYERSAQKQAFTREELAKNLPRGIEFLTAYFNHYEATMSRNVLLKYRMNRVKFGDLYLNGEIDKMDLQGNSGQVVVTDWKTGKAKSRNEILGKTKNADGNYYRQLVFYKLLLRLYSPRFRMLAGEIDFIQHDDKGDFHRERFEIEDSEVADLEGEIKRVADEIVNLAFWDRRCGEADCPWCALRDEIDPLEELKLF